MSRLRFPSVEYIYVHFLQEIRTLLVLRVFENGSEKYCEILRVLLGYRRQRVCALTKHWSFLYFSRQIAENEFQLKSTILCDIAKNNKNFVRYANEKDKSSCFVYCGNGVHVFCGGVQHGHVAWYTRFLPRG